MFYHIKISVALRLFEWGFIARSSRPTFERWMWGVRIFLEIAETFLSLGLVSGG